MDSAWISAFSAVKGSLVGAFTSFVSTYVHQQAQYRRDFLSKQFAQRENLYSEFINEAARLMVDSLEQEVVKASTCGPDNGPNPQGYGARSTVAHGIKSRAYSRDRRKDRPSEM